MSIPYNAPTRTRVPYTPFHTCTFSSLFGLFRQLLSNVCGLFFFRRGRAIGQTNMAEATFIRILPYVVALFPLSRFSLDPMYILNITVKILSPSERRHAFCLFLGRSCFIFNCVFFFRFFGGRGANIHMKRVFPQRSELVRDSEHKKSILLELIS